LASRGVVSSMTGKPNKAAAEGCAVSSLAGVADFHQRLRATSHYFRLDQMSHRSALRQEKENIMVARLARSARLLIAGISSVTLACAAVSSHAAQPA
jgi:hypothetical protein